MSAPRWLTDSVGMAIQADQVRQHGGSAGLRDRGLLESALDRPRNRQHYEPDSDLPHLAAALGFSIARNHPFVDGNKRIAFQAMYVFFGLNGLRIEAEEEAVVRVMLDVASGVWDETELASWLREHSVSR